MRADGEPGAVEVGDQALFVVHGRERRGGVRLGLLFQQWAGGADGALDLPERVAAVKGKFRFSDCRFRDWKKVQISIVGFRLIRFCNLQSAILNLRSD